jgi:hypothetical protein
VTRPPYVRVRLYVLAHFGWRIGVAMQNAPQLAYPSSLETARPHSRRETRHGRLLHHHRRPRPAPDGQRGRRLVGLDATFRPGIDVLLEVLGFPCRALLASGQGAYCGESFSGRIASLWLRL